MEKNYFKTSIKILAFMLSILMAFYAIPTIVFADAVEAIENAFSSNNTDDNETVVTEDETNSISDNILHTSSSDHIYEAVGLREESVKHFRLEDGSYVAAQYNQPIHVKDANGNWQDIDNTIADNGSDYSTTNARVKFAKKTTGNNVLFTLHDGKYKITIALEGANKKVNGQVTNTNTEFDETATELQKMMTLDKLSSRILYPDILNGVDLEYVIDSLNIKENIIVKEKQDNYNYTFTLKLNNLEPELQDDGSIIVFDPDTNAVIYTIPAPVVFDSNYVYADADKAEYTLIDNGNGKYSLTVAVDSSWMNAVDRVFPVVIDPAIHTNTSANINDYYQFSPAGASYSNYTYLDVGFNSNAQEMTAYFEFNGLPEIPANAYFISAKFQLSLSLYRSYDPDKDWTSYPPSYELVKGTSLTLGLYNVESNGSLGDLYEAVTITSDNQSEYITWDVTSLYQTWHYSNISNNKIAIERIGPHWAEARFVSSEAGVSLPQYIVNYRYQDGLEDYWTFIQQDVGGVGTGAVNVATGNMIFSVPTMSTTDGLFSFTPSLIYNASKYNKHNITAENTNVPYKYPSIGKGWMLNVNETIVSDTYTNNNGQNETYYIWTDGDGTAHAFYLVDPTPDSAFVEQDPIYKDEDGLGLTLTTPDGEIIIEDSYHTKRHFTIYSNNTNVNNGAILTKITDISGNVMVFILDSYGRVDKITVKPNGSAAIQYLDFTYNTSNYLSRIDNLATGDYMTFTYESNSTLTQIKYYYSSSVFDQYSFSYTNNRLSTVKDEATAISITYTYDTAGRVSNVTEGFNISDIGQQIGIEYTTGTTTVRTSGSNDIYDTNDDLLTHYTFDRAGRVVSAYTSDVNNSVIYGATNDEYSEEVDNRIKSRAISGGTAVNLISNGGFDFDPPEETETLDPDHLIYVEYLQPGITIPEDPFEEEPEIINELYDWVSSDNVNRVYNDDNTSYAAEFDVQLGWTDQISQRLILPDGEYTLSLNCRTMNCEDVQVKLIIQSVEYPSLNYIKEIPVSEYYINSNLAPSLTFTMEKYLFGDLVDIIIEVSGGYSVSDNATVTVDNVMLERNIGTSEYNIVNMGGFTNYLTDSESTYDSNDYLKYWKFTNNVDVVTLSEIHSNDNVLYIQGHVNRQYGAYQEIPIYPPYMIYRAQNNLLSPEYTPARYFKVSAFGKGTHQISSGYFGLCVDVVAHDDSVTSTYIPFNNYITRTQYTSGLVKVPEGTVIKSINVYCLYANNPGIACFDNITVIEVTDATATEYDYTEDGKLESAITPESSTYYKYNDKGDLVLEATLEGNYTAYNYSDSTNPYILTSQETGFIDITSIPKTFEGIERNQYTLYPAIKTEYTYNNNGLLTQTKVFNPNNSSNVIVTSTTYDVTSGSKLFGQKLSVTDENSATTRYVYDHSTCLLMYQVNPDNVSGLYYIYDNRDRLVEINPLAYSPSVYEYYNVAGEEKVSYSYDNQKRLSKVNTATTTYLLTYDQFGNLSEIAIEEIETGESPIVSYNYNLNNGKLSSIEYGNGTEIKYYYNELDQVEKICYDNVTRYLYQYTVDGKLYLIEDYANNLGYLYSYDGNGKIEGYTQYDLSNKSNTISVNYTYDEKSRLHEANTTSEYYVNSNKTNWSLLEQFTYNENDLLSDYRAIFENQNGSMLDGDFRYDLIQRPTSKTYTLNDGSASITNTIEYTYDDPTNKYSSRTKKYTTTIGSRSSEYTYFYDSNSNITRIDEIRTIGGIPRTFTTKYYYDDLNQLIREDNPYVGESYVYTYDYGGNRTGKVSYLYTTGDLNAPVLTETYGYNDSWGDLLTIHNGNSITYDNVGNPNCYYIGDDQHELLWTDGRLLQRIDSIEFDYNLEGIRSSKTVGNITHYYTLDGSRILTEQWDEQSNNEWINHFIAYIYDEQGSPIGMQYRTSDYAADVFDYFYFEKNLQGDVIAVYSENGINLLSYEYDAWGNFKTYINSTNVGGAQYNPFRYRSYYYDSETGLYYLNSRYYNPDTGRFLNADEHISSNNDLLGFNMFIYCSNNPVTNYDPNGEWSWKTVSYIILGVVVAAGTATFIACTGGAALGAFTCISSSTLQAVIASGIVAGTIAGTANVIGQLVESEGEELDLSEVINVTTVETSQKMIDVLLMKSGTVIGTTLSGGNAVGQGIRTVAKEIVDTGKKALKNLMTGKSNEGLYVECLQNIFGDDPVTVESKTKEYLNNKAREFFRDMNWTILLDY